MINFVIVVMNVLTICFNVASLLILRTQKEPKNRLTKLHMTLICLNVVLILMNLVLIFFA